MIQSHDSPQSPPEDDAVLIQASWHEPDRFAEIFHRYFPEIHRYIARRLGPNEADDLAAETFLAAFRKRRSFDPGRGAVRPWLYGMATNLIGSHHRAEKRYLAAIARSQPDEVAEDHGDLVADRVSAGGNRALLAGLAGLPAADRNVLLLVALADLSYGEVADALGIPAGTVASRLYRARRFLLAAATKVTTTPGWGAYWVVRSHQGSYYNVGPKARPYRIVDVTEMADWTSGDGKSEWFAYRDLGARPVDATDRAAWRAAGSPSSWKDPGGSPPGLPDHAIRSTPDRPGSGPVRQSNAKRPAWSTGKIPNDPARIRKMLLDSGPDGPGGTVSGRGADTLVFHGATDMLAKAGTPAIRATVYRILAGMPDLQVTSNVRDPDGRMGTAVTYNEGTFADRVIIDPATGQTLASEQVQLTPDPGQPLVKPGGVLNHTTITSATWSAKPPTS